ncbi:Gfo/Idh/MocA family oxidoreductase [Pelagicoccus sp. SDUM812002]|uniref:Gfo/Idh/MocA family protein n=1 Tax=Pelagicoccus sp. SDUM812002 TaxID=3041266 RepID=UPI00280DE5AE|nr:Gfo/Idh/MocA family oxidoreductase [Pelagicoccus sp. SDUM812002]MDQ8187916.1 Gfo/Idh/MocA family oxidoreductase [Pelagicoccus sp. SDUM812002]
MSRDGMNYAPEFKGNEKVVETGEFVFAAAFFDHGHIYGQIEGLASVGGTLGYIYEPQAERYESVLKAHPEAKVVSDFREILDAPEVKLVTAAAIPNLRCEIGIQVMDAGKDYFTDKCPVTSLEQLDLAKAKTDETGKRYMVCYSERLSSESGWYAGELIKGGAIGRVLQVLNLAPHNLAAHTRPDWFFDKQRYGGILTDIGSHQCEQFLEYTGATDGVVNFARVDNLGNPNHPGLEDFGEASLTLDTGASAYCRLDWFNPAGSKIWGDGRTFVLGTDGYLEIRKYRDIVKGGGDHIYLVDQESEKMIDCAGKVGYPFYGKFVLDCLNRTEHAMTQAHAFKAAELSLKAQQLADKARS